MGALHRGYTKVIDVHCHLASRRFEGDRHAVVERACRRLEAVIVSGTHPGEAEDVLQLCSRYKCLQATLGLHPVYAAEVRDGEMAAYLELIRRNRGRLVGIGEIGLDYYRVTDGAKFHRMREVFGEFLELAKELELPAVLHLRQALDEGLETVVKHGMRQVVFHCFNGTPAQAEEIAGRGYYISIATNILRSDDMAGMAAGLPLERVLTETDSPYLGPRRRRNVPENVGLVVDRLAEVQGLPAAEVDRVTSRNARRVFELAGAGKGN